MVRPSKRLLALCSAAVVCTAGIVLVDSMTAGKPDAVAAASSASATAHGPSSSSPRGTQTQAAARAKGDVQKYKDGTYTGVGTTRIGSVQVTLTLRSDKITRVQITGHTTHYPISYINPTLPDELLARQDIGKIDVISGATQSTEDFYYAVVSCLQQARDALTGGQS